MCASLSTGVVSRTRGRPEVVRRTALILAWLLGIGAASAQSRLAAAANLELGRSDRVLILAPHPDDEVLGCGGVIQRCRAASIPVRVVFLTYGDNNEWSFLIYRKHVVILPDAVKRMGLVRHDEAVAAARSLGLTMEHLAFLGYPDFGTYSIWMDHWGSDPPLESMLTRVTGVPYANAMRPGAPYKGEAILEDLSMILQEFRPTKVFVSHPADFNPDHRALYLFTRAALWSLEQQLQPDVYPYLVHFPKWPQPRAMRTNAPLTPPPSLEEQIAWETFPLSGPEIAAKTAALQQHRTQFAYAGAYLESFVRTNELFGEFPVLRFVGTNADPVELASRKSVERARDLDILTESERQRFIGIEWRRIQVTPEAVRITIALSRPLAEAVWAEVQVDGHRADRDFAAMPKLKIKVGRTAHLVLNRRETLPPDAVTVSRSLKDIEVRVPLRLAGNPERLLVSARTYLGDLPLDWVSWRMVDLRGE